MHIVQYNVHLQLCMYIAVSFCRSGSIYIINVVADQSARVRILHLAVRQSSVTVEYGKIVIVKRLKEQ